MNTSLTPAKLVFKARKYSKLTQKEFASLIGKDQTLISKYENSLVSPPSEVIMHCMHILNPINAIDIGIPDLIDKLKRNLAGDNKLRQRRMLSELLDAYA